MYTHYHIRSYACIFPFWRAGFTNAPGSQIYWAFLKFILKALILVQLALTARPPPSVPKLPQHHANNVPLPMRLAFRLRARTKHTLTRSRSRSRHRSKKLCPAFALRASSEALIWENLTQQLKLTGRELLPMMCCVRHYSKLPMYVLNT